MSPVNYLIKVNIAIVIIFGLYWLLFKRDTFFRTKRHFFLFSFMFALIYPFLSFNLFDQNNLFADVKDKMIATLPEIIVGNQVEGTEENLLLQILYYTYFSGVALRLIYFIIQLSLLVKKIYQSSPLEIDGIKVRMLKNLQTPFSFFRYIVLDPEYHPSGKIRDILVHEKNHADQYHSVDVICSELMCIICWFNPLVWLMKRELRMNLEFMADQSVLNSGCDTQAYQLHLLQLSYHKAIAQLSNNFNVSPLKKRIVMMNKKKTSRISVLKYALFVPFAAVLLFMNSMQAQDKKVMDNTVVANVFGVSDSTSALQRGEPYSQVEMMPQFPGGDKALMQYLVNNLKYPQQAVKDSIQGRVICRFIVDHTGRINNVEIVRGLSPETDAESMRVIKEMPLWNPGKQNGKSVDVYYTIPIRFQL